MVSAWTGLSQKLSPQKSTDHGQSVATKGKAQTMEAVLAALQSGMDLDSLLGEVGAEISTPSSAPTKEPTEVENAVAEDDINVLLKALTGDTGGEMDKGEANDLLSSLLHGGGVKGSEIMPESTRGEDSSPEEEEKEEDEDDEEEEDITSSPMKISEESSADGAETEEPADEIWGDSVLSRQDQNEIFSVPHSYYATSNSWSPGSYPPASPAYSYSLAGSMELLGFAVSTFDLPFERAFKQALENKLSVKVDDHVEITVKPTGPAVEFTPGALLFDPATLTPIGSTDADGRRRRRMLRRRLQVKPAEEDLQEDFVEEALSADDAGDDDYGDERSLGKHPHGKDAKAARIRKGEGSASDDGSNGITVGWSITQLSYEEVSTTLVRNEALATKRGKKDFLAIFISVLKLQGSVLPPGFQIKAVAMAAVRSDEGSAFEGLSDDSNGGDSGSDQIGAFTANVVASDDGGGIAGGMDSVDNSDTRALSQLSAGRFACMFAIASFGLVVLVCGWFAYQRTSHDIRDATASFCGGYSHCCCCCGSGGTSGWNLFQDDSEKRAGGNGGGAGAGVNGGGGAAAYASGGGAAYTSGSAGASVGAGTGYSSHNLAGGVVGSSAAAHSPHVIQGTASNVNTVVGNPRGSIRGPGGRPSNAGISASNVAQSRRESRTKHDHANPNAKPRRWSFQGARLAASPNERIRLSPNAAAGELRPQRLRPAPILESDRSQTGAYSRPSLRNDEEAYGLM
jgi:hypothetical protein